MSTKPICWPKFSNMLNVITQSMYFVSWEVEHFGLRWVWGWWWELSAQQRRWLHSKLVSRVLNWRQTILRNQRSSWPKACVATESSHKVVSICNWSLANACQCARVYSKSMTICWEGSGNNPSNTGMAIFSNWVDVD